MKDVLRMVFVVAYRQVRNYWRLRQATIPLCLHVGCGSRRFPGFINIDLRYTKAVDYICDAINLPCPPNSVQRIESYHMIEHIPIPAVEPLLARFYEMLVPGGLMIMECPHLEQAMREYLAGNEERLFSIYGRQRFAGDAHHWGYTPESLTTILTRIGFVNVSSCEPQDSHATAEPCLRLECTKPIRAMRRPTDS